MMTHPTVRFMLSHPAHCIALGFGTGLAPVAPGTVGTLLAYPLFYVLSMWVNTYEMFGIIAAFFLLGV